MLDREGGRSTKQYYGHFAGLTSVVMTLENPCPLLITRLEKAVICSMVTINSQGDHVVHGRFFFQLVVYFFGNGKENEAVYQKL